MLRFLRILEIRAIPFSEISDLGIKKRDEIVTENFFSKGVPLCGVLGGGYNKDFKKLVELHAILHKSCASIL